MNYQYIISVYINGEEDPITVMSDYRPHINFEAHTKDAWLTTSDAMFGVRADTVRFWLVKINPSYKEPTVY